MKQFLMLASAHICFRAFFFGPEAPKCHRRWNHPRRGSERWTHSCAKHENGWGRLPRMTGAKASETHWLSSLDTAKLAVVPTCFGDTPSKTAVRTPAGMKPKHRSDRDCSR